MSLATPLVVADRSPLHGSATSGQEREDAAHGEPPYQAFVLSSLTLAVLGGFLLATLLPLSTVLDWDWGARYTAWVQAHGQVQVLGWVGLFIMGMAYRMMPRFSGRPLRFPFAVWASCITIVGALILRLAAAHLEAGAWRSVAAIGSGALGVVAGAAFALVVLTTLIHPRSRAGATGLFFALGASAFLIQAMLGLALMALSVQRGENALRPAETAALLHLQFYGFIAMFILGVAMRAVPTFSGLPRPERSAKSVALALAIAVGTYAGGALWSAFVGRDQATLVLQAWALASLGPVFLAAVWLTGVFRPAANRLRPASQPHIWFVRSAFFWLALGGGLAAYYGVRAAADGAPVDYYGADALRHVIGLGVASLMIVGMAILVLPEFAIRRLRRPQEGPAPLLVLLLLNAATAVRVASAVAAPQWLSPDRYWPMAVAGGLAWVAVSLFAFLFVRNLLLKQAVLESMVPLRAAG